MLTQVTIRDEQTTRLGQAPTEFILGLPAAQVTVRDLIRARIEQEVERYNQEQPEFFKGLVQPSQAEQTLNGFRMPKKHTIDPEQQVKKAFASFEQNGFLLLVDDYQLDQLDDAVILQPNSVVTFLKLVPLVGG